MYSCIDEMKILNARLDELSRQYYRGLIAVDKYDDLYMELRKIRCAMNYISDVIDRVIQNKN